MKRAILLLALALASCGGQPMPKVGEAVAFYSMTRGFKPPSTLGVVKEIRGTWVRLDVLELQSELAPERFRTLENAEQLEQLEQEWEEGLEYWVDVSKYPRMVIDKAPNPMFPKAME